MKQTYLMRRREFIALGALSLGGGSELLASGCAHVPASSVATGQKLMRVRFQVAGQIQPLGSANPYYYFIVINLTDTVGDPGGPVPIVGPPYGNAIAAPPATAPSGSQGFVGFVQYDSNSGAYGVYVCPIVGSGATAAFLPATSVVSPTGFTYIGIPDSFILPSNAGNTLDITIDLNRLKALKSQALPAYVQVNIILYNNLPINSSQTRYWDAIGDGRTTSGDYKTLSTAQSGQSVTSDQDTEPTGDVLNSQGQVVTSATQSDIANIDLSYWSIQIQ